MSPVDLSNLSITAHRSPYPGLRPYLEGERDLLFGRDAQIREVLRMLEQERVVAILGGSGCGKSSLVRAGVIPDLRAYGIPGRETWVAVTFTPLHAPIVKMAEALESCLVREGEAGRRERIQDLLMTGSLSGFFDEFRHAFQFGETESQELSETANLLVLVDQFEEVFRQPNQKTGQMAQLIRLVTNTREKPHERVFLIFTMRSEYLDQCANDVKLSNLLNASLYLTRRLDDRKELREVIEEPARRYAATFLPDRESLFTRLKTNRDWPFEGAVTRKGVVDWLLLAVTELSNDTDHLPLLQHLLFWLWRCANLRWQAAAPKGGEVEIQITEADLRTAWEPAGTKDFAAINAGRVLRDCLNNQAQRAYESLSEQQRNIARHLFCLLADFDPGERIYRRRWSSPREVKDVCGGVSATDIEAVLLAFTEPHPYLRVVPRQPGAAFRQGALMGQWEQIEDADIDVCHESLIRNWATFGLWLQEERQVAGSYERLLEKWHRETPCADLQALLLDCEQSGRSPYVRPLARLIGWLRRFRGDNTDLLSPELVEEIGTASIEKLNAHWARRYLAPMLAELRAATRSSRDLPEDSLLSACLHQAVTAYYQRSRDTLRFQRVSRRVLLCIATLLLALLGWYQFDSWRMQDQDQVARLQLMVFQPHAVATGIGGSAQYDDESRRPYRLWQLAFALHALEDFERQFKNDKTSDQEDWPMFGSDYFRQNVEKVERLRRIVLGTADRVVRKEVSGVPWLLDDSQTSPIRPTGPAVAAPSDPERDRKLKDCVLSQLPSPNEKSPAHAGDTDHRLQEIKTIYRGSNSEQRSWTPALVQLANASYLVAEPDSGPCQVFSPIGLPGGGFPELTTDPRLRLLLFRVPARPGKAGGTELKETLQEQLHIFRVHWFTVPNDTEGGSSPRYQADAKWMSSLAIGLSESVAVATDGSGFTVTKEGKIGESRRFAVPWTDRPTEISANEIEPEPAQSTDAKPIQTICKPETWAEVKGYHFSPAPVSSIDGRYLGYVLEFSDPLDPGAPPLKSIRVIEPLSNSANPNDCSSYRLSVASLDFFKFPPIKKIWFGIREPIALFMQSSEGRYYKLIFGPKPLRRELCRYLPKKLNRPAANRGQAGQIAPDEGVSKTSQIFEMMLNNQDGSIGTVSLKPPCEDL